MAVDKRLDKIRHFLAAHLGGVNVDGVDEQGNVRLKFTGACEGCASQPLTFGALVSPAVREVPGVASVATDGRISHYAQRRIDHYFTKRDP